jgi:hypothetical protein
MLAGCHGGQAEGEGQQQEQSDGHHGLQPLGHAGRFDHVEALTATPDFAAAWLSAWMCDGTIWLAQRDVALRVVLQGFMWTSAVCRGAAASTL